MPAHSSYASNLLGDALTRARLSQSENLLEYSLAGASAATGQIAVLLLFGNIILSYRGKDSGRPVAFVVSRT